MNNENEPLIPEHTSSYGLSDSTTGNKGYGVWQQLHNYAAASSFNENEPQEANRFPQYMAAIAASLSAVASGMVLAWTSPITSDLKNGQYHNITINSDQMGWIGSFVSLGAMTMCFPFGIICDTIGRKSALLLLIIPFGIGWSLIIWAKSLFMIYCGRFITGMASGACCVGAPLYSTEIAQKEIRGSLGGYFQLMTTVGIFLAYLVGKYATITQYTIICAVSPLIFVLLFVFQPESPLYSIKRMKIETALKSLRQLRGPNYNIYKEVANIASILENSSNSSFLSSFSRRTTKKALFIIISLMFFQQMSGVNAIIFYTSEIFNASGTKLDAHTATILVGTFQVIATFISSIIVEKLGRKVLLIASDFLMAVSCVCLGTFFMLKDHGLVSNDILSILGFLPIVSLCMFIIMFSIGLGPIPWSISGEIFTPEVKSVAASIAATFNWFLAFLITKFYLQLEEKVGADALFYTFSFLSFGGALFCYYVVPETKGKTIEEIQDELGN